MSRLTTRECDGCGARDGRPWATLSARGWRTVTVHFVNARGDTMSRRFDVCQDELCGARVVDLTRPGPPLRLVRREESSRSGR